MGIRRKVVIGSLIAVLILMMVALIGERANWDMKPLIPAFIILVIIVGVATGAFSKNRRPSYNRPPSMKQLAFLRKVGYDGPMPTSSQEAWDIISDIKRRRRW